MLGHYREQINLADIAAATGLSKSCLYEAFHKDLGRTPLDVLTFIRLNKAKQMLRETDRKVHVIADDCGFGLVGNFYHHFKQSSDVTPIAYRKQSRT